MDRLGIFYTDNTVPHIIDYSLKTLVSSQEKVDIVTCSWTPIPDNPFPNIISYGRVRNYLNIVVQILQLLYRSRPKLYKYVSFLEHDVLYPPAYFDFPEFDTGSLINDNYLGLHPRGFSYRLKEGFDLEPPLHQTTMIFSEAVAHFEKKILESISKGMLCIEPNARRQIWSCQHCPIHINHGANFTTHYLHYSIPCFPTDSYWGSAKDISDATLVKTLEDREKIQHEQ